MKKNWIPLIGLLWILTSCQPTDVIKSPLNTIETNKISQLSPVIDATLQTEVDSMDPIPETESISQNLIDRAIDDLAARLGVDFSHIEMVDAQQFEWPDASLGCPQPDIVYSQVITLGYRITLKADEKFYLYHTDSDNQIVFCPRGLTFPINPGEIQDGIPWMPVDNPDE